MINLKKSSKKEYGVCKQGKNYIFTAFFDVKKSIELCILNIDGSVLLNEDISSFRLSGNVFSVEVSGIELDEFLYYYIVDGKAKADRYRTATIKKREFGSIAEGIDREISLFKSDVFDFSDDLRPAISQPDVVAYLLHIRGFSKHASSKVTGKGCFLGITEKIPYFKELGINQLILMPAYDFYEYDTKKQVYVGHSQYSNHLNNDLEEKNDIDVKLNYWGYKSANYFCPKYEYSYSKDAVTEFKDMVKALHAAGIEIVMQMYYEETEKASVIFDSLKFWYTEYHVDGFHIMGKNIPVNQILSDDYLYDAKLYFNDLNRSDAVTEAFSNNRNVFNVSDEFLNSMRHYLKSDSDSLNRFVYANRVNNVIYRNLNYITKYEGFTLNDLVSYEHKHNDANGENNLDGNDYNLSWNCGIEGKSSKKAVKELRIRQIKNALALLFLSQGTPMLFMGDEFMNTQSGNNNPYCQDNEISWLNWKSNSSNTEILEFTKALINYRNSHKVLHQDNELKNMDYIQCGTPDISYHQDMAWKADLNNYLLHIGIMLSGEYNKASDGTADDTLYIAYNMHWENHTFGLPRLKGKKKWELVFATCTESEKDEIKSDLLSSQEEICIYKRSVVVLKASGQTVKEEK